ncbi:Fic family protein [Candidatus Woesearchaeota archaeon]|nr:Fic family protein [Candidatus Woesearchaeota archaeon]
MAYVVTQEIKGRQYYYLVHNYRDKKGGWKKKKKYLGTEIPDEETIESMTYELTRGPIPWKLKFLHPVFLPDLDDIKQIYELKVGKDRISKDELDFLIHFTHHSNAIEGSTLNLVETKDVVVKGKIPRSKRVEEVLAARNTKTAYEFVKNYRRDINKAIILRIHKILMQGIMTDAGKMRKTPVKITGANFQPPMPDVLDLELDRFMEFYRFIRTKFHPVEVAALSHLKFIELHPFTDGNGRTGRILMNFILTKLGYPPLIVQAHNKMDYYRALEAGTADQEYTEFVNYVAKNLIEQYK